MSTITPAQSDSLAADLVAHAAAHPDIDRLLVDLETAFGAMSVAAHPRGVELRGLADDDFEITEVITLPSGWREQAHSTTTEKKENAA